MRDAYVHQLGDELPGRGLADEKPHLLEGVGHPREEDEHGDADGADRVEIPHEAVTDDGHDQAEDVDDDVVAVVDLGERRRGASVSRTDHRLGFWIGLGR